MRDPLWGVTPWQSMTREDLERAAAQAFSAVRDACSALELAEVPAPYWQIGGRGHRALEKCRQVLHVTCLKQTADSLWRSFFRYADDLLFWSPIGYGWHVCDRGHMTTGELPRAVRCELCNADVRPLAWDDLRPRR